MQKREIKFRAWYNEQMVYWNLSNMYASDTGELKADQYCQVTDLTNVLALGHFMQFTGLKDKNGKEIYEGDIIKCSDGRIAKVVWSEYAWHIESTPFSKMEKSFSKMDKDEGISVILMDARRYGKLSNTEVIGNIYSNPELL